ncbi:MAG: hypothetical protein KatS3mg105_4740 [Gemmatales bacterium]|nr:MAG: hypothetical protein KatS3mg105_4740 [Gemmatales bacterium]
MNPNDPQRYLDPLVLAKVRSLELQARMIVEGYLSGMHKSPYHGFSVEFAQHREYVPGDDIRHVDWKVYGRTERYFLKQYEEETNLICWLLLDISESMRYGSTEVSKYDYACMASAALAHLVLQQQDSVGLVTFDDQVRRLIKPSSQPSHLKEIVQVMNQGAERQKTKLAGILHELAERFNRRGLVMVFSDLFDDSENAPGDFVAALKHLRHRRHDVVVFHVLGPCGTRVPVSRGNLVQRHGASSGLVDGPPLAATELSR